jgi:hypothetical protein
MDVCKELGILCRSFDLLTGIDACDAQSFRGIGGFEFVWLHPPYWRQKRYSESPRDLSNAPTLAAFLARYALVIKNCASVLAPEGKLAILMGDYTDRAEGFCPLVYYTKRLCFEVGLRQCCTDIIRFSHGASSSRKTYRSSFIPGLHDVVTVMEKPA